MRTKVPRACPIDFFTTSEPRRSVCEGWAYVSKCGILRIMEFKVEVEREGDGRWIAEVNELPGVLVYGDSVEQAQSKAQALALRVLADRLDNGEAAPFESVLFAAA